MPAPRDNKPQIQRKFWRSTEYRDQVNPENPNRVRGSVKDSLKRFLSSKRTNPQQSYGNKDYPFTSAGQFAHEVPGLMHAHLSQDLSIVYKVQGNEIYLFGIFSHADLGTGNPPNIRKQTSMARRFANMTFTEE